MNKDKILRFGILLQIVGLVLEIISILRLTPATFLIFLALGVPLVLLGCLFYLVCVFKELISKEVL